MTSTYAPKSAELQPFTQKSDWRGAWCVLCQWGLTLLIFWTMANWPNWLTIPLGIVLLGGRQLGFFVLTHEMGHRTLFKTQWLNDFAGTWLTSPMDYTNGRAYMREHLMHHQSVGSETLDPDIQNYRDYPIARARLKRKLKRDLTGQTGWRNLSAKYRALCRLGEQTSEDRAALLRGLAVNLLMLGIMVMVGHAWLYLAWLAAQLFVYPAIVRIRQIAEHAAVPKLDGPDANLNTRTTRSHPLARLIICPHQVNYHVEHHLLASIPIYRLRAAHRYLKQHGYYDEVPETPGYATMLRSVTVA